MSPARSQELAGFDFYMDRAQRPRSSSVPGSGWTLLSLFSGVEWWARRRSSPPFNIAGSIAGACAAFRACSVRHPRRAHLLQRRNGAGARRWGDRRRFRTCLLPAVYNAKRSPGARATRALWPGTRGRARRSGYSAHRGSILTKQAALRELAHREQAQRSRLPSTKGLLDAKPGLDASSTSWNYGPTARKPRPCAVAGARTNVICPQMERRDLAGDAVVRCGAGEFYENEGTSGGSPAGRRSPPASVYSARHFARANMKRSSASAPPISTRARQRRSPPFRGAGRGRSSTHALGRLGKAWFDA